MSKNLDRYCFCCTKTAVGEKAAALLGVLWPAPTAIRIKFLEGDPALQERVKQTAREWLPSVAPVLDFEFSNASANRDTDIRIAFKQGKGSWSYLGTDCLGIDENEPTMNFGWLTPASSDEDVRSVVLHEFGHALGLIHEHQNPIEGGIQWNEAAVRADLSKPPNRWDDATIQSNMFQHYDPSQVRGTPPDKFSIMMYMIPATWTDGTFSSGLNTELTEKDKAVIREVYPA